MTIYNTGAINVQADAPASGNGAIVPVLLTTSRAYTAFDYALNFLRSNSTSAMSDTLPDASTLVNGWKITIFNRDASASITVTPTLPSTINATTTLTIAAGKSTTIYGDGTNYWATLPI